MGGPAGYNEVKTIKRENKGATSLDYMSLGINHYGLGRVVGHNKSVDSTIERAAGGCAGDHIAHKDNL